MAQFLRKKPFNNVDLNVLSSRVELLGTFEEDTM
jgi:hypothetical protein